MPAVYPAEHLPAKTTKNILLLGPYQSVRDSEVSTAFPTSISISTFLWKPHLNGQDPEEQAAVQ
jgi:hypothetical protein